MSNGTAWRSLVRGTEEQVEALTSLKPLTVVSAGAGTGKTQTLAQRFAWLLASDPECKIREILVLTFTKKAAREMRDRIKETLSEWYIRYPDELAHLKDKIENIDDGYISTIHSFAMRTIRESGLALDIDPTASVMPEPKASVWWKEYAAILGSFSKGRVIAGLPPEWTERAEHLMEHENLTVLMNAFGPDNIVDAAKACSEKLYCAGQSPEALWAQDGLNLSESISAVRDKLTKECPLWRTEILPTIMEIPEFAASSGRSKSKTWERFAPFISEWNEKADWDYRFFIELFAGPLKSVSVTKEVKAAIESFLPDGVNLKGWRDDMKTLVLLAAGPSDTEKEVHSALCKVCAMVWAAWDEYRLRENQMTIADLIFYASKVLRSSDEYKNKFKHIMVDEFQDTDPLQNGLIEALWNRPESCSEFQNTLFIVGDQKQSIYRFRHADLTLFSDYIARCRGTDCGNTKYVPLNKNFRTVDALLDKFNIIFGKLWGGSDSPVNYERLFPPDDDEAIKARSASAVNTEFEIICSVAPYKGEESRSSGELRTRLYEELGARFASMYSGKMQVWDKDLMAFRNVRWGDFAVLVPTRTDYIQIERVFDRLELPYMLSTNKSYFARGEIGDIVNFISLLAEPENPVFLAGWLSSPVCGIALSEAELLIEHAETMMVKGDKLPLLQLVKEERPDLYNRLYSLRRKGLLRGASYVILELLKEPRFLEYYGGLRRRRVNANIIYLSQLAGDYEKSQGMSLKGCAEYLQIESLAQGRKEEPDFAEDGGDLIQVMTIHASKGLEFPVVALVYNDKKNNGEKQKIVVSKKYGVVAKSIPDVLQSGRSGGEPHATVAAAWESFEEKRADKEEQDRLWYVGFTRAKNKLILCSAYKETQNGERETWLDEIISDTGAEVGFLREDKRELPRFVKYAARGRSDGLELEVVRPAKLGRISASAYAMLSWCPEAYRIVYRQGRSAGWTVKGGGGRGSEFGILTHWLLSRWDFKSDSLRLMLPDTVGAGSWNMFAERIPLELREKYASDSVRSEIRKILARFCETDECIALSVLAQNEKPARLFREMPFRVPLDGTVLVGSIDLYWLEGDVVHLRDWKSSDEESAPSYYYEKQLDFYACALDRYFNRNGRKGITIDSSLIYLRSEGPWPIKRYCAEDLERIASSIEDAAIKALAPSFEKEPARCGACPWRTECGVL